MNCKICDSEKISITYKGKIRNGAPGYITKEDVPIYQCMSCKCIWHTSLVDSISLYQLDSYRESMGESVCLEEFYTKHDAEILQKLNITGTSVYRGKIFMDIGCGGGGYADYINGVAQKVVLIEPNKSFAKLLREKGYEVFHYSEDALCVYQNRIDVLTTYDVIEHVDDPKTFLNTIYNLLAPGGVAFIGTPTDYPVLRRLIGSSFDNFVFSVQHPWVFSSKSLELMARECGFCEYSVEFYQRYGIGNLIAWLQTSQPKGDAQYDFITSSIDGLYKSEMAKEDTAEYLVLKVKK